MEPGDKYLTIRLVGHNPVSAFPNAEKKDGDKQPDFKGDGIAVWINEKREEKPVAAPPAANKLFPTRK